MCFISVGRYLGIRNPLHARQAKLFVSRRAVLWRIATAWLLSTLIASPITLMSIGDSRNIVPHDFECAIANKWFRLIGKYNEICDKRKLLKLELKLELKLKLKLELKQQQLARPLTKPMHLNNEQSKDL